MSAKPQSAAKPQQVLSQDQCLRAHAARHAAAPTREGSNSSVSEAMEDAVLFMVRYLQEVQGPKHVVGRDFAYIAATPEARRLFLSTARHLMLQLIRSGETYLSVTNFHDLLCLMCPDFQLRVVKSAFKAAWVVLKDRPRATPQPKLPFEKFWKCLELTWLYEPYFLSVRRYVFDSDSHRIKMSAQVKQAVLEVEEYIRRENWPAIPHDIMKDAIGRASVMHGDTAACHFDGIVRVLCVSERLRHHIKLENNPTTLAARQAAIAAATALAEKKRRSKMAAAARDGSILRTTSMDRVTSYGSFGGHSLDRTTSFGSAGDSGSPRSSSSFEQKVPMMAPLPPAVTRSKESSASGSSGGTSSGGSKGSPKPAMRGVIPVHSDSRVPHSPADSVSEITAGREVDAMKIAAADIRNSSESASEIQPCD
jgi:hypothetical protein